MAESNLLTYKILIKFQRVNAIIVILLMLSARETAFIEYWKSVRESEATFSRKLLGGLPLAMVFGMPIIISVLVVYLYFPDWYAKLSGTSHGSFVAILLAVFVVILFFSYFRMQFKWEMNEQLYRELLARKKDTGSQILDAG